MIYEYMMKKSEQLENEVIQTEHNVYWILVISSTVAVLLDWLAIGSYGGGSLSRHPAVPSSQSTETP